MPDFQLFLADLIPPDKDRTQKAPESGEIASGTEEPAPPLGPTASPSPTLIIMITAFALAAIVAIVLISLKARRGSSARSEPAEPS